MTRSAILVTSIAFGLIVPVALFVFLRDQPVALVLTFLALFAFAIVWNIALLFASVIYRLATNKHLFGPDLAESRYFETWRSGRGFQRVLSHRLATRHCLWISIADDQLSTGAMCPFNLLFIPEFFGLECDLRSDEILIVEIAPANHGVAKATIRFDSKRHGTNEIEIALKDPDKFNTALEALR